MATATTLETTRPAPQLSPHDSSILTALFDPESSPSSGIKVSTHLATLPHISGTLLQSMQSQEAAAIRPLNIPFPPEELIRTSIKALSDLIFSHPGYAPAYLNRAQATRLQLDASSSHGLFHPLKQSLLSSMLSDLGMTIKLTTPSSRAAPISQLQADLLVKAHTHRGYLLLQTTKAVSEATSDSSAALPPELAGKDRERLEEMASRDFFLGGQYGNKLARQMSVQTNPYAKMCGAIVKEALRKERQEYERGFGLDS